MAQRQPTTVASRKPALTIYQKSVKEPHHNMLKPGKNNAKLGDVVTAKMWQGSKMYSLTLEERATCPTTCDQWNNCYGNNMPFAHRFDVADPSFYHHLDDQLERLSKKHANGFVIRLHVLGDFFSTEYVAWWGARVAMHANLRVFGYTHHPSDTPIGQYIARFNRILPQQWAIRFSDQIMTQMSAHVVQKDYVPMKGLEIVCPEQTGQAASCADCGLCWAATNRKIMFVEH